MLAYDHLTPEHQQRVVKILKDLGQVAKTYQSFNHEYQIAQSRHLNLDQNFNQIFNVAKKYGIGGGALTIYCVQSHLMDLVDELKGIAQTPNSILHQALDDIRMVSTRYGGRKSDWLDDPQGVSQDGNCLVSDIAEIKNSFKMKK